MATDVKTFHARSESEWRNWLEKNHAIEREIWLVFYKKGTGRTSISYDEALDLALCFGWIDSMIRRIDDLKYVMRFTPRRPGGVWSRSNILRVETLAKQGKMTAHGAALFSEGNAEISSAEKPKSGVTSFPPQFLKAIKKNEKASKNFQKLAPGYKRRYLKWITSAKTEETRPRRVKEAVDLIAKNVKSLMK